MYTAGEEWKEVENAEPYGLQPHVFNQIKLRPVATTDLRIEVRLKAGWSGGICEWEVE